MISFIFRLRFETDFRKKILLSSFAWGIDFLLRTNTSILLRLRFEANLCTDTSILFRSKFEMIFLPSSARGLEWFCSSSARDSKLILVKWYSYPLSFEVRSWSLKVTCSLYWTYTWMPIKLGSVPILHLKANQTCSSNFTICLLTWTYPSLPVWLCFWLCHAYLLDWTYTFNANAKRLQIQLSWDLGFFENSDLIWILPSFSPNDFLKLLSGIQISSLCVPISDKKIYIWCNVLCNVWSWMTCPSI